MLSTVPYQCVKTTKSVIGGDAHFTWIDESFLLDHEVAPWQELPLWLPESHPLNTSANNRAVGAGLIFRPLENTIHTTWDYLRDHPDKATLDTATLGADKEIALLREWRNK